MKSCWSFCVCVIHPCAGVLPFWVPYLPNPLTDFFDIWRIGSPYLHPPNLQIRLAISFFVVEIFPYLCHLPLHSVSYILSDLRIRSHNSHQTLHIVLHRYSASTLKIASPSEQPFLPTVASTLCPHFVPYLLHLCRYTRGNLYTATRRATLDTCQTSLKSHQPFRRYSHIFSICPVESAATKTLFLHQYLSISPTIWRIVGPHIPLPICVVEAQSELWLLRTSHICVPSFFPVLSRSYPPPFPFLPYSLLVLCCLLSVQCV